MAAKTNQQRIEVYPADFQILFGRSYRTAARRHAKAREDLGKTKGQPITITEICMLYKLDYSLTAKKLKLE